MYIVEFIKSSMLAKFQDANLSHCGVIDDGSSQVVRLPQRDTTTRHHNATARNAPTPARTFMYIVEFIKSSMLAKFQDVNTSRCGVIDNGSSQVVRQQQCDNNATARNASEPAQSQAHPAPHTACH